MVSRRQFIAAGLGATLLAGCSRPRTFNDIPGRIVGASLDRGHRLRTPQAMRPTRTRRTSVVIAGGGVAGLSAAWRLARHQVDDFLVLDLEGSLGGNSRYVEYPESAAPWGGHYLPLPTTESDLVRDLLQETGCLQRRADGTLRPTERYLCHDPQERLFYRGGWHAGLFPQDVATREDLLQYRKLRELVVSYERRRDAHGRKAFAIPIAASSPQWRDLDRITMREFLQRAGINTPLLQWFVEYGCRDDYGCSLDTSSAWAGLHYLASRDGGGFSEPEGAIFTWPEGNGWLIRWFEGLVGERAVPNALVTRIESSTRGATVDYIDTISNEAVRIECDAVVCALPRFVVPYVVSGARRLDGFTYAPWWVANVVVDRLPRNARRTDVPLCWDNVVQHSRSLGYVVATHQSVGTVDHPSVLSWFFAEAYDSPQAARTRLLERSYESLRDEVLSELVRIHPDILPTISRVDIMRWGHAMIRPTPGFIWGAERPQAAEPLDRIAFAHSDLSGISIFEEAQYHGVRAADYILKRYSAKVHR